MKVTPATKKGYLLKKSSIETKIASMLILLETCSAAGNVVVVVSEAKLERGEEKAKERIER